MLQQSVRFAASVAAVLMMILAGAVGVEAARPPLWGSLEPGDHGVGFRTIEQYDSSRTFRPKTDYFGNRVSAESARPIQALVWYPAQVESDALAMSVSEYVTPTPQDEAFYPHVTTMSQVHAGAIFAALGSQGAALDANNLSVMAVRDAQPAAGRFPLIVYFSFPGAGFLDNLIMCEYLASHGFAVVSTHSFGPDTYAPGVSQADIEARMRDMEYCLALVRRLPFVAGDRLGVFGTSGGAMDAWLLQMRNYDVEALVALDPSYFQPAFAGMILDNAFFDAHRATVPSMHLHRTGAGNLDRRALDSCRYGERTLVTLADTTARIFSCYGAMRNLVSDTTGTLSDPLSREYVLATRYLKAFLSEHVADKAGDESLLGAAGPWPQGVARVDVMAAVPKPPTPGQFVAIINTYGMARAVEVYERFKTEVPAGTLVPEAVMNNIGYGFLQGGRVDEAVQAFRMNAEAHPNSANVWDSYADGALATGDTALAISCYRQVLQKLPQDTVTNQNLRQTLRANAERGIETLSH